MAQIIGVQAQILLLVPQMSSITSKTVFLFLGFIALLSPSLFCVDKIKWIENFDTETLEPEKIQNECILNPLVLNRRMTLGEIANGMAHKYIYQQILEND